MEQVARAKSIIRAAPEKVYQAFVDPESMGKFWFSRKDEGFRVNEAVKFYLGSEEGAFGFDVHVLELNPNSLIHIKWGDENGWTEVKWLLEAADSGDTILTIEERGFAGSNEEIIDKIVDSSKGFNQVIIAAKALIEHGVAINVVSDHA